MSQFPSSLDRIVNALQAALGENLYSCCVYGSAVRGDAIPGVSDLNLLIVLKESNPAAHLAIAEVIASEKQVDPFILGRRGFDRSARAFAPKFLSIQRNYKVLRGADPLKDLMVDAQLERFLAEQALRNLRLRLVYAFVTRSRNGSYPRYLARCVTPVFLRLSEVVRLSGKEVPAHIDHRASLLAKELGLEESLLRGLLAFKKSPQKLSDDAMIAWHQRLFTALDQVVYWVETNWPP